MPSIHVIIIPSKIFPFTFLWIKNAVIRTPTIQSTACIPTVLNVPSFNVPLKERRPTKVEGLSTRTCPLINAIITINNPIPADTPVFNDTGIELNIASRTLVN